MTQVGKATTIQPQPGVWHPQMQYWPPNQWGVVQAPTDYANLIEVVESTHDAVLTFYRETAAGTKRKIVEITVPKGALATLKKK